MPVGAQAHKLPVEVYANSTAHADDHRLTFQSLQSLLEVVNDVLGDLTDTLLGSDDGLQLGPLRLELLRAVDFLALGGFLEVGIDVWLLVLVEGQLGESALVVDGHRRLVLHRAPDVVDADVVAEYGAGVGVLELDGRPGKADERGVWQRVPHIAGVAVDEVVLAAVGLVGDDDDVAPLRKRGMGVAPLLGEEFLYSREDHAAGID